MNDIGNWKILYRFGWCLLKNKDETHCFNMGTEKNVDEN